MKEEKMPLIMRHIVWLNLAWQWRYPSDNTGFLFWGPTRYIMSMGSSTDIKRKEKSSFYMASICSYSCVPLLFQVFSLLPPLIDALEYTNIQKEEKYVKANTYIYMSYHYTVTQHGCVIDVCLCVILCSCLCRPVCYPIDGSASYCLTIDAL